MEMTTPDAEALESAYALAMLPLRKRGLVGDGAVDGLVLVVFKPDGSHVVVSPWERDEVNHRLYRIWRNHAVIHPPTNDDKEE